MCAIQISTLELKLTLKLLRVDLPLSNLDEFQECMAQDVTGPTYFPFTLNRSVFGR